MGNAESYDWIVATTTLGQDSFWKSRIIRELEGCVGILELASGTGILSKLLEKSGKKPAVAIDLSVDYLVVASRKGCERLVQADASNLPCRDGAFGAVVSSYLVKYVDPKDLSRECHRALTSGGTVVFHDFALPRGKAMKRLWKSYFWVLRRLGKLIPQWNTVFSELDSTIEQSNWIEDTIQALHDVGFVNITCKFLTLGTAAIITGRKS